jgi:hypothetical protein
LHNVLCHNTFGVWLYHIFPHYILKYTIFRKEVVKLKWTLWICLKILNDTFLFKGIILREVVINVLLSLCKLPVILIRFREANNFINISCKNYQTTFFLNNPISGSGVTRCGLTDSHHEPNIDFPQICEASDILQFVVILKYLQRLGLTFRSIDSVQLDNEVTFRVKRKDVVSPTPKCCKSDISERNCIVDFLRISNLKLHLCGSETLHTIYRQFTKLITAILWTVLQYDNVGYWVICIFCEKMAACCWWIGKMIEFSDCESRFEHETSGKGVWAKTYLSICMLDYISGERKQDTFNTR